MAMTDERAAERNTAERGKAVDAALASIEKQFGRGAIMTRIARKLVLDTIPTGSIALDLALGVGGIPRGRITEIFGPESSGKTTVCQHVLAEAQARGGVSRSSTSSTRSTLVMPAPVASTSTSCSSASPTPASRRSRSPRRSSAPAGSTASSSTRWRPSCRAPRSRARWATASWASRPG